MDAISCLAPPTALLSNSFADAAIARALHFSISDTSPASVPSPLLVEFACAAAPAPPITCESVLVAETPRPYAGRAHGGLGPAGGRAGKRRSRASKRAPTTYISTDPANFRLMVQQVTGVQADPMSPADGILPAFDASMLLAATCGSSFEQAPSLPAVTSDEAELQQQQPCFPTLDSWSVMYERSEPL